MDNSNYPRPDAAFSGPYPKDKTWGIVIIVLSALGICLGGLAAVGGGVLGALGAGAAVANRSDGAAMAAGGGLIAILGFVIIGTSVLQLVGGVGIMGSKRWGFLLTAVMAGLSVLADLVRLPSSIIGLVISGVILYYCYQRLSGKEGPALV